MLGVGRWGPYGRLDPGSIGAPDATSADVAADPAVSSESAPPDAPAPDAAERDAWVVLDAVFGIGPVSFARLLRAFGSAVEVLGASRRRGGTAALVAATADPDGGPPTLTGEVARAVADAAANPDRWLVPVRRAGLEVLTLRDESYPSRLREIELPPPVLFVRGRVDSLDRRRAVAIVGTRRPTEIGRGTAARIADAVAGLGATVVSGLALGIDAAAHHAAVRAGSPTVAVIGGGHGRLYPAAHRSLVEAIVAGGGAVVSEFGPDTIPTRGTFPRRNRIISGLSDATIVVEAGARSGALTTAAWALEQGRSLHIVPGRLDDPAVAGCLAFLREAGPEARIVAGIPELLEDLDELRAWQPAASAPGETVGAGTPTAGIVDRAHGTTIEVRASARSTLASLPAVERAIAMLVVDGRSSVDELVDATELGGATILGALTALEMRGLLVEAYGRYRPAGPLAGGGTRKPSPATRPRGSAAGRTTRGRAA